MTKDVSQAQNSSRGFYLAFQRCMEERLLPSNKVEVLLVPAVVCAAFSIELGFKTLLLRAGRSACGHNLQDLFNKLEPATQNAIVGAVGIERQEFDASLKAVCDAFVGWRYLYERAVMNIELAFVSKLATATQDTIVR